MINDRNHGFVRKKRINIFLFDQMNTEQETLEIIQLNDYNVSIKSEIYMIFFVKNRNTTIMDMQEIIKFCLQFICKKIDFFLSI